MISTPSKMNVFLQRMLKMGDDECESSIVMEPTKQQVEYSPRGGKSKWIRKFTNSPSKSKSVSTPSPVKTQPMPMHRSATLPSPQGAQDMDKIIREFEVNYMSPRKRNAEEEKNGKYVKKMVAVFEQKYKSFNNTKDEIEENRMKRRSLPAISDRHKESLGNFLNETYVITSPSRKLQQTKLFNLSASSSHMDESSLQASSPKTEVLTSDMDETLDISFSELDDTPTDTSFSKMASPGSKMASPDSKMASPVRKTSSDMEKYSFNKMADKFQRTSFIRMADKLHKTSFTKMADKLKRSSFNKMDETVEIQSFNDETLDLTQSFNKTADDFGQEPFNKMADDVNKPASITRMSYSKMSMDFARTVYNKMADDPDSSKLDSTLDISQNSFTVKEDLSSTPVKPQKTHSERAPKIVGAFLKKPIEVEDTSIDWIPITGKKLPRKHSFKKLLSILTGRRSSAKGSKLFCSQSQNNLNEELAKEHHDSGYSEKSSSTSSLQSLASISEMLHHQEPLETDKRTSVTTFQASKETAEEPVDEIRDGFSDSASLKKLVFEEIPRSEVRLSLGPSFPLKNKVMSLHLSSSSIASGDIGDYSLESEEEAPSPLPKHPFLSGGTLERVELRRHQDSIYDTPRSYLSKSEPGLFNASLSDPGSFNISAETPVYDVPVVKVPPRPKSSVYEDALSLKRRTVGLSSHLGSEFYAFQADEEPHYATVKPRNTRILPSKDLLRSMGDLSQSCRPQASHYVPFSQLALF